MNGVASDDKDPDLEILNRMLLDEVLTPEEDARLAERLQSDHDFARAAAEWVRLDQHLFMLSRAPLTSEMLVQSIVEASSAASSQCAVNVVSLWRARQSTHRKLVWIVAAAAAIVATASFFVHFRFADELVIQTLRGSGTLARDGREWPLSAGLKVASSDRIRVASDSSADLVWKGDSGASITLMSESDTTFRVRAGAKEIELHRGNLTASVQPQPMNHPLRLRTPHAHGEVLGTRFDLSAEPARSALTVASGKVVFAHKSEHAGNIIAAGERVEVRQDGTLETQSIPVPEMLRLGLSGHWTFEEGSGEQTTDRSAAGLPLRLTQVNWSGGRFGGGIQFAKLEGGRPRLMAEVDVMPRQFTIAAWMTNSGFDNMQCLAANSPGGIVASGFRWFYGRVDAAGKPLDDRCFNLEVGNGNVSTTATSSPVEFQPGQWHHVALTFDADAGQVSFFFDGRDVTRFRLIRRDASLRGPLTIGNLPEGGHHRFNGAIDDLRLYSRLLALDQIRALATDDHSRP